MSNQWRRRLKRDRINDAVPTKLKTRADLRPRHLACIAVSIGPAMVLFAASGSAKEPTRFYSPQSFWNHTIPKNAKVHPHSRTIIEFSLIPYSDRAAFANGDDWGISVVSANEYDKIYTIACKKYYCNASVSFPIPQGAQPSTGADHHLTVLAGHRELDMWEAAYDEGSDSWSAGARVVEDLYGWGASARPGRDAGGAIAAGFAAMGGVVRPEEIAQGHIDHALSVMIPHPRSDYVRPATATDGSNTDPNALPEGAHIRLDPKFNVAAQRWPAWEKIIATALQRYGAYVSDTGGAVAFYGQTDINTGNLKWSSIGVPKGGSLADLPWSHMQVLWALVHE